jgi:hypothetical protein
MKYVSEHNKHDKLATVTEKKKFGSQPSVIWTTQRSPDVVPSIRPTLLLHSFIYYYTLKERTKLHATYL